VTSDNLVPTSFRFSWVCAVALVPAPLLPLLLQMALRQVAPMVPRGGPGAPLGQAPQEVRAAQEEGRGRQEAAENRGAPSAAAQPLPVALRMSSTVQNSAVGRVEDAREGGRGGEGGGGVGRGAGDKGSVHPHEGCLDVQPLQGQGKGFGFAGGNPLCAGPPPSRIGPLERLLQVTEERKRRQRRVTRPLRVSPEYAPNRAQAAAKKVSGTAQKPKRSWV